MTPSLLDLEITHPVPLSTAWLCCWQQQEDAQSIYPGEKFLCRSNIHGAPWHIWCSGNEMSEGRGAPIREPGAGVRATCHQSSAVTLMQGTSQPRRTTVSSLSGCRNPLGNCKSTVLFQNFGQGRGESCSLPKEPTGCCNSCQQVGTGLVAWSGRRSVVLRPQTWPAWRHPATDPSKVAPAPEPTHHVPALREEGGFAVATVYIPGPSTPAPRWGWVGGGKGPLWPQGD